MPVLFTGCTFSLLFLPLCGYCEWSGQCRGCPDHIPDCYWAEPGQAGLGKITAAWRQHFSGVLSGGPGQRCYDHLSMFRQPSFPGSVCVYSGFGDPHKAKRIDNRLHELGHAGQTNTGASRSGKPDSQSASWASTGIHACSFITGDPVF